MHEEILAFLGFDDYSFFFPRFYFWPDGLATCESYRSIWPPKCLDVFIAFPCKRRDGSQSWFSQDLGDRTVRLTYLFTD